MLAATRDGKLVVAGTHRAPGEMGANRTLGLIAVPTIATVRNDGPAPATNVGLTITVSQGTGPARTSQGICTPSPVGGVTTCSLKTIPAGGEVLVAVDTSVDGFEEGLFATSTATSPTVDLDDTDNTADVEVQITHEQGS